MDTNLPIYITNYITNILVFESYSEKHKPLFVPARKFYSLTYRYSGKISISCGGETTVSTPNTITFVPKGVGYTTEILEDTHIIAIHFDFTGADAPPLPCVINPSKESDRIRAIFQSLARTINNAALNFMQLSLLYELLHELKSINQKQSDKMIPEKICKAKEIIEVNYSDPFYSIERIAEDVKVSTTYLRREFKSAFGHSPIKYLKNVRIKAATKLLLTRNMTIAEIAAACGYTSTSYFIQDFHKIMGDAPNQYRNKLILTP